MKMSKLGNVLVAFIAATAGLFLVHSYLQAQAKQASVDSRAQSNRMDWGGIALFRQVDKDHDGFITQQEWIDYFVEQDKNKDGKLSMDELNSLSDSIREEGSNPNQGRMAAFERLDVNKDDVVSATEWPGQAADFRYLDANHDGVLSREEFLSDRGRWWNEIFENLDFDGNHAISRSEWLDSDASFDRLDRDHNGIIAKQEFYNPR
jgi:Ca2+-binding EF-hand superfamily protein